MKLDEKLSEELIKESTRSEVESHLEKAIECQKRRGRVRDYTDLVRVCLIPVETPTHIQCFAPNTTPHL